MHIYNYEFTLSLCMKTKTDFFPNGTYSVHREFSVNVILVIFRISKPVGTGLFSFTTCIYLDMHAFRCVSIILFPSAYNCSQPDSTAVKS